MTHVWVFSAGDSRNTAAGHPDNSLAAEVANWLEHDLRQAGVVECAVERWVPFRSQGRYRGRPQAIVLLVGDWKLFTRTDYLALTDILALHTSSIVHAIPIIRGGAAGEPQEDPWAERNRQLWNELRRILGGDLLPPESRDDQRMRAFIAETVRAALLILEPGRKDPREAVTIFVSYCHRDEALRDELGRHLKLLERTGLIQGWHDRKIVAGEDWAAEIDTHLYTSDLILLLLSSDFFASDYCTEIEARVALERHRAEDARAIPVLLRPVVWQASPLSALQALPKDAMPVTDWPSRDKAFVNVCEGILGCVMAWKGEGAQIVDTKAPQSVSVRRRVLDAAMPGEVEIDKSAMLVVLIRKATSKGLRALLEVDRAYGIDPEEVRSSKPVRLEFPVGENGRPAPASVRISLRSPDFDPPAQERTVLLQPDRDSQPVILMVAAQKLGQLSLVVELYQGENLLATQPVSTVGKAEELAAVSGRVLSAAFDLAPAEPGEFTRMFQAPRAPHAPPVPVKATRPDGSQMTPIEPPKQPAPGPKIGPGEYTQMQSAPPDASMLRAERDRIIREMISRARKLVESGEFSMAQAELEHVLVYMPESPDAKIILQQLEIRRREMGWQEAEKSQQKARASKVPAPPRPASAPPPRPPHTQVQPPSYARAHSLRPWILFLVLIAILLVAAIVLSRIL